MFHRLTLCILLLIAMMTAGSIMPRSQAQDDALPLIFVPSFGNGRILMPQQMETLEAVVTDRNRTPLSDIGVLFITTESGASGSFLDFI